MVIYYTPRGNRGGSAAVYELLEYAYRIEYGEPLPEIKRGFHGKPYFPGLPDVHFSLSHAATHVLCALASCPVGCDIESPRKISSRALEYFSTPDELLLFEPLELWVLKESYVKLYGQTIASIRDLRFSREGEVIIAPDTSVSARLYKVGGRDCNYECPAAVCCVAEVLPDSIILV